MTKSATLQALHSSASCAHGTPLEIISAAREVIGDFDLDPASSEVFNEAVMAKQYYSHADNGLSHQWSGAVFLNPPSGEKGKLVKRFWEKLTEHWVEREVECAIYIGFSIDQLQTLQNTPHGGPLQLPICVPNKRLKFASMVEESHQMGLFGKPEEVDLMATTGESPTKPNFICLLPSRVGFGAVGDLEKERFEKEFSKFGEVRL